MDVKLDDGPVDVTLSRRNLIELLAELDDAPATREACIVRHCGNGVFLRVVAQEDDDHYGDRIPGTWGMLTGASEVSGDPVS